MSTRMQTQVKAAPKPSFTPVQSGLLQRKCACGGTAGISGKCEECSKKKRFGLQTKLKVNEPGDIYEREADRIADQVMATPVNSTVSGAPPYIQRFSEQSNGQMNAAPTSVDQALGSPGRPLEPTLRQDMEHRFGHDFSRVRVHSGAVAEQSARNLNAYAYTVGHDIVFSTGRFAPGTQEGRRLLAHELTHVVHQTGRGVPSIQRKEKEGRHNWTTVTQITAESKATGRGRGKALTSDGQTLAINIEANNLSVGRYETSGVLTDPDQDTWSRMRFGSMSANRFVYLLPPGVTVAQTMTVVIEPASRAQQAKDEIRALAPHIRDFLLAGGEPEASGQDLLSIASAGRILQEHGVTEDELLLQRQRRIDWQRIGLREGETTDPETWALSYVGYREKARVAAQANAASLLDTAKRISLAPPEIIRMMKGNILGLLEPSREMVTVYRARIGIAKANAQRDSEPIIFSTFEDLQQTVATFEEALLAQIHNQAAMVLNNTEAILLRTDEPFKGMWKHIQSGPGFLWTELEEIKKNPEVKEVEQEHKRYRQAIGREEQEDYEKNYLPHRHIQWAVDEYRQKKKEREGKLEKEQQQYMEKLRETAAKVSKVKLSPGTDVVALLSAETPDEAQQRLVDALVKGRSHVRDAREELDDRKFLYSADKIIESEKKDLEQALGSKSGSGVVSEIIDRLVRARRSQTKLWDDIFKLIEIVAMFIPGLPGWMIRLGIAAANYDKKTAGIADQADAHGGGIRSDATAPNAALWALVETAFEVLTDSPLSSGAKKAGSLTRELGEDLAGKTTRQGERAATGVGTSAVRGGEESLVKSSTQATGVEGERALAQIPDEAVAQKLTQGAAGESKLPPGGGRPSGGEPPTAPVDVRGKVTDDRNILIQPSEGPPYPLTLQELEAAQHTEAKLLERATNINKQITQSKANIRSLGDQVDHIKDKVKDKSLLPTIERRLETQEANAAVLESQLKSVNEELAHVQAEIRGTYKSEQVFAELDRGFQNVPVRSGELKGTSVGDFESPMPLKLPGARPVIQTPGGTPVRESVGAKTQPGTFQSASAAESSAVHTAIRADVAEAEAYKWALGKGEIGLQRPGVTNAKGADFITAVDGPNGVEIIVTDPKSSILGKFPTPEGPAVPKEWLKEVDDAVKPDRLNLGDSVLEERIRAAAAAGKVRLRQVNVDNSPAGGLAGAERIKEGKLP